MPILLALLLTLPLTLAATRLVLAWLRHKQILDHPNERSSHSLPTPRGGGLAVTPMVLAGWAVLGLTGPTPSGMGPVIGGAFGLLALSWLDDRGGLPARLRLALHLAAAALGAAMLPDGQLVFQGLLPLWADRALAVIGWVWFINLYNFMDGIDGITGVETASVGTGLLLLAVLGGGSAGPLAAVLVAAALGFLAWNWHPAKIFLGDSGSVPLGYLIGWLLLSAAGQGHWAAALILPGYYLADATLTLAKRALRRENLFEAHREHFYQQAVRGGARHSHVATLILATNVLLIGVALLADAHPWAALAAAAGVVATLLFVLARLGPEARR